MKIDYRSGVPRNSAEAERFLWHAMRHIETCNSLSPYWLVMGNTLIHNAIKQLQSEQAECKRILSKGLK